MAPDRELLPGLSIVVPVFNSEPTCAELVARLHRMLDGLGMRFEVLLVNDGSSDASWARICELAADYPAIRGIDLMRNYGQHNAVLCGIRQARYDVIVTMDDDLQHPPEEVPRLLEALGKDHDVVYGTPERQRHEAWRNLASEVTKLALQSAMRVEIARSVSPFRVFRTALRDAFADYAGPFVSIDVLLTWGTTRFAAIPVGVDRRRHGVSHYTFRKLITHALNMLTGFSVLPLQVASVMGFVLTLFGAGILVFVLTRWFVSGDPVPGFPFLASVIAIFSGAQLFALGIIGEYLARMHFRMMTRPTYTVRGTTSSL
jgi:glycosyltransferase involved in cell wall biosynthesis